MRKIINGFLYDTDTADLITVSTVSDEYGSWYVSESLYKKKKGEYFLYRSMYGDGDAEDIYYWVLSHQFSPLTEKQAKDWMEKNADTDTYMKEFGLPEE